jgi:hypothetical protein
MLQNMVYIYQALGPIHVVNFKNTYSGGSNGNASYVWAYAWRPKIRCSDVGISYPI